MILKTKDLQRFYGVARSTAVRYKRTILDSLGKTKQNITDLDLAQYEMIEVEKIQKVLKMPN